MLPDAGGGTSGRVSIVKKEEGELLSPFWFTATDEAYRKLSRERTEIKATLEVSCEEYGAGGMCR